MEIVTGLFELLISGASILGRLVLWAIFSPKPGAWPVAGLLIGAWAVLGYRLHPSRPLSGIGLGIAASAVLPLRLYLVKLQKPRPSTRTVQRRSPVPFCARTSVR